MIGSILTKIGVVAVFAAALSCSALAQQSCFARQYSDEHLSKNPNQSVAYISIAFEKGMADGNPGEWADTTVRFRDDPRLFSERLWCFNDDGTQRCGVECDGGNASLRMKGGDMLLLKTEGFWVNSKCGEGKMRRVGDVSAKSTTFRLNRAAFSACPSQGDF